jgi:hypothetical protein
MKFLPVFTPNDYFWKHHQRSGEEKVETYMRVVHSIMMKSGGFLDGSQWVAEDRFEYIKKIKGIQGDFKDEKDAE